MEAILIPAAFGLLTFLLWKWIDPLNAEATETDPVDGGAPDGDGSGDGGDGGGGDGGDGGGD